jgi:uncharacterized caspase-like protein
MAASRADQVSWEVASLGHGLYTYALLEALDGRADAAGNGNGMTSMEECFTYLSPRVLALALAHAGEVQTPQLLDRAENELEICGVP